jgi:hypothetical protein
LLQVCGVRYRKKEGHDRSSLRPHAEAPFRARKKSSMDIGVPETEREIEIMPLEEPVPRPAPVEEPVEEPVPA